MSTREAFDDFVAARYQALVRTARLLVANSADAEDLVQEALARCVPTWDKILGNPEPYVRTVMVRTNISRWRKQKMSEVPTEFLPDRGYLPPDLEGSDELLRALAQLAPRQRAAVVLRHVEDRSERETAELMGCSLGSVKSTTSAGLARLRAILGESRTEPPSPGQSAPMERLGS